MSSFGTPSCRFADAAQQHAGIDRLDEELATFAHITTLKQFQQVLLHPPSEQNIPKQLFSLELSPRRQPTTTTFFLYVIVTSGSTERAGNPAVATQFPFVLGAFFARRCRFLQCKCLACVPFVHDF